MQEGREEASCKGSFNSAEQETAQQRLQKLIEKHSVLQDELRGLISEEAGLIAMHSLEESDYVRIEEIAKRETDIVNEQKELIDEMARLRQSNSR